MHRLTNPQKRSKMKKIVPKVSIMILTIAMFACKKENPSAPSPPGPSPEPILQNSSIVGTSWESIITEDDIVDKSILCFITDSTGTEYAYLEKNEQTIFESLDDIKYHFDTSTLEGFYYLRIPEDDGCTFYYNTTDTTILINETNRVYHLLNN